MTTFLVVSLLVLFIVQIVTFLKVLLIIRHTNRLLFEVRLLFKHSGVQNNDRDSTVLNFKVCQHCKHRLSFIQISNEPASDNFYYKCKKHDIEILLSDTCDQFAREYSIK